MSLEKCFHCGLPNPPKPYTLEVAGKEEYFCCTGCRSAAETIISSGLGDYYRFHQPDQQPVDVDLNAKQQQALKLYDRDDIQSEFVLAVSDELKTATLIIEGVSCSACTWLIEKRLSQLPGIQQAIMNAGTHRLSVGWNPKLLQLSQIFENLFLIGYRAAPFLPDQEEKIRLKTQRQFILRLGVAGIGMMQAMMNAVALYSGDILETHEIWLWWTSLFLTLPVIFISAWPFFTSAYHAIRGRQLSMDVSVSIAIISAFIASVIATITGEGEVFYESVNMFTFFLVLSRFLEFRARTLTGGGNALNGLLPQTCTRLAEGSSCEIPVRDLTEGNLIRLLPGETCPVDGTVEDGASSFDESSLTGEFKGVVKQPGDTIYAGTINQSQPITLKVAKVGSGNTFNLLQQLTERASTEKPRIAELADRGSRQFIWSTLIITLIIGIAWLFIDSDRAFWVVISVLVVTCPCALSLATPTALAQATSRLKADGFVITRGYVLERLAELKEIAFDKTGTLTEGSFAVTAIRLSNPNPDSGFSEQQVRSICSQLERNSEHAVAKAFTGDMASEADMTVKHIEFSAGLGVQGNSEHGTWRLGSSRYTAVPEDEAHSDTTVLFLTLNNRLVASIELQDRFRSTTGPLLNELSGASVTSHVLTGDANRFPAAELQALGLTGQYQAGLSAEEKLEWVKSRPYYPIAVVGDGINDAPVLAGAAVSIAMLNATDLTKSQADVLLLNHNLLTISKALRAARKTKRIIRQNLLWALIYNAIALPVAAMGLVSPWQAAIGMSLSSLLVVGNALRLRRY
ncbi:heavy metal translocating P-type ATPase [Reinekea marinisedimentorum]|uniref:Cu2+-exporting ATPase n=1 Tax=Reinekea marinisedimentorum TaxID=230495 RepID=A0A4R3I4F1_9GAMM|nr:heavy metal translocating P-type ATPase [Reinekea marinisedimentorum]TCS40766.1 Cu2+-exporting ATPase [Reinekea marinisedimentorum]